MSDRCKKRRPRLWRYALLAFSLASFQPVFAFDDAIEREQLALLVRQLDMLDRMAARNASSAPLDSPFHFDYGRLHSDIERVRIGVQDYLTPQRAQPRDQVEIVGNYRRRQSPPRSLPEKVP